MVYLDLGNWKTEIGVCVDANGKEAGYSDNLKGFTEETCFALCEESSNFK